MQQRLAEEWDDIVEAYADARHYVGPERVTVTIDLVARIYNTATAPVAVLIPAGYRTCSPDSFLVPTGFGDAS